MARAKTPEHYRHTMTGKLVDTGGFRVQKADTYEAKYICLACSQLLKLPIQLPCGHRICSGCAENMKKKTDKFYCKPCQETQKLSEAMLDKGCHLDMLSLNVTCYFCEWSGKLEKYEEHLEQQHTKLKCQHCNETLCGISALQEHEKKSCEKKLLDCVLRDLGCKGKFLKSQRESHFMSEEHQKIILVCVEHILLKFAQCCAKPEITESSSMDTDASGKQSASSMAMKVPDVVDKYIDELKHLHEAIDILSNGVTVFQKDLANLDAHSSLQLQSMQATEEKLADIKTSTEESSDVFNGLHTNISLLQEKLMALKRNFDDQQVVSYDGTLIWKITGVQEKMTDAKSERQVSVYSPAFRSSPTGYNMCARLYLYGDGNARRTHMSLFFVLLRGPHDSLLRFPFNYKVTFCLYDQTGSPRHIVDSFRPDTRSNSFQRPLSNMNIASGIPKFAPLSIIENPNTPYIKNDAMFIKVLVDFENIPKPMLPFVVGLNPGLPMHIQHKMIREEAEKREKQSQPNS